MGKSCDKMLPCGHPCPGFAGEPLCHPCLVDECVDKNPNKTLGAKEDDYCTICYTAGFG